MGQPFNLVDAALAVLMALSLWAGWRRGFVRGTLELATLVLGVLAALRGHGPAARWLEAHWPALGVWTRPLAFVVLLLASRALLGALAQRLVLALPKAAETHTANRAFGLLPGAANGVINATLLAVLLLAAPLFDGLTLAARDSVIANRLTAPAQWVEAQLAPVFDEADKLLTGLTVQPQSTETMPLRFTVQQPRARPELEARMLALVNAERQQQGLRPLQPDPQLAEVARAHSRDMFARGYFSHLTPEGRDPFDRMRQAEVRFLAAGENLALAPTLPMAHQGLMNSPGHRANILRPAFGRVGIGVLDGGMHGLMVTQNFRN
jgi:uncharacterized protein YkwD